MSKDFEEIEQLISDDRFRMWVFNPDRSVNAYWQKWSKDNPEKIHLLQQAKDILTSFKMKEENLTAGQIEAEYDQLKAQLKQRSFNMNPIIKWAIAASILLFLSLVITLTQFSYYDYNYTTSYGEKKNITLPDDSEVTLNANSNLKYNDWDEEREVWIAGEAFFKVQEQYDSNLENLKFLVHMENLDIEVIGTEFNVTQRHGISEVVLNEGKIKLYIKNHNTIKEITMLPGERVQYEDGKFYKTTVEPKKYSSWLDDRLVFENTPLLEIARKIEDNFGYRVVFNDKQISQRKISGTVPSGKLEILLSAIQKTFNIRLEQKDNTIIIKSNNQ
ncbi:DUF4974 domain-containing protein [Candidatus Peregrinibacteria bacterium]|nr:DUF4974 domain-containing protein [Candidatus Peregrinibacteria bacterium]